MLDRDVEESRNCIWYGQTGCSAGGGVKVKKTRTGRKRTSLADSDW
jgi:hypothetical protein